MILTKGHADALTALLKIWKMKRWSMECRQCGRFLPITRDGHLVEHHEECHFASEQHPWRRMRNILNGHISLEPEGATSS